MDHNEFIELVKPGALKTFREYNILPSLTISQAILETGWGNSMPGNMLFGIKWTEGCGYDKQLLWTTEYVDGKELKVQAWFRKYNTVADSIEDHAKFLVQNSRYASVLKCTRYGDAAQKIQEAGYATDPDYAKSLISIIESNNLQKYDQEGFKMFNDFDKVDAYAQASVLKAKELGIMSGDDKGNFNPQDYLKREDLAVALVNLYQKLKG